MGVNGRTRMLLQSEIVAAQSISKTGNECARNLGVHVNTYKKYALMYGIYDKCLNRTGRGTHKSKSPFKEPQPIDKILENKYPNAKPEKVLKKLIRAGIKQNECGKCGFREKRISDDVIPLILCFNDDNRKNFSLDNLEICCFNCAHNLYDAVLLKKPKRHQQKTGPKCKISKTI